MKMTIKKYFAANLILLFVLLIFSGNASAQTILSLENRFKELSSRLNAETSSLDSLKNIYNQKVKEIDRQKRNNDLDESTIKKLMAASIGISNKIDQKQKKVSELETEIEKLKWVIENRFTAVIDSLTELKLSNNYKGNKEELEKQILVYTEKKVLIAPKIYSLQYSPEKILTLKPSSAATAQEKNIYNEYLREALNETETKLNQIHNLNAEVKQTLLLQKKTKKFLEDVEFSSGFSRSALAIRGQDKSAQPSTITVSTDETRKDFIQVNTYLYILKQLDVNMLPEVKSKNNFSFDSKNKNLSLQEYADLLTEVENRLTDYRLVLKNKISTSN